MKYPSLNEATIRSHTTAQSFERGEASYRKGAVVALTQRGNSLIGQVEGSDVEPYRVTIQFDAGGLTSTHCTCAYNFQGWCKHIVATLLASCHNPSQIEHRPSLSELLKPLNRTQLQTLLETLSTEHPQLVDTIELHLRQTVSSQSMASKQTARRTMVDPKPFRCQVQQIIYNAEGDWNDTPALNEISILVDKACDFTNKGDGDNALVILEAIIDAYGEIWMNLDGSSGESGDFFYELDAAFAEALLSASIISVDQLKWQSKLGVWSEGASEYGIDDAFARSQAALNQGWDNPLLQAVLKGETIDGSELEEPDSIGAMTLVQIRLNILERQNRDDEYLNLAKATGHWQTYLTRLIDLGQLELAMIQAKQHLDSKMTALAVAQALREQGALEQALEIAKAGLTLPGPGKAQLALWTSELAEGLGHQNMGLQSRITVFKTAPTLADYLKIQELAQASEWHKLKQDLLDSLRNQTVFADEASVAIFLHEGLLKDAINVVDQLSSFQAELVKQVMKSAMLQHPDWVISNSRRRAESIMNEGKAKYYQYAVKWLMMARMTYQQVGQQQEWQRYYGELLQQHARKRKLIKLLQALKQP
ncbi:MAG: SWIM zinc finger family protein [Cyanobacteria bacterium P01_C01_bin.118]